MTRDEATAAILAVVPLSRQDLDGFLACTDEERAELVVAYRSVGVIVSPSVWAGIIAVLKSCVDFAALITPLGSAVELAFGLTHL